MRVVEVRVKSVSSSIKGSNQTLLQHSPNAPSTLLHRISISTKTCQVLVAVDLKTEMRVFVTGAGGFVGQAVLRELIKNGHQVLGLARSDASADVVAKAGAEVHRGDIENLESLRSGAQAADGVIHLAFIHDFSDFERALAVDRTAIQTMGDAMAGTGKPLVIASGEY